MQGTQKAGPYNFTSAEHLPASAGSLCWQLLSGTRNKSGFVQGAYYMHEEDSEHSLSSQHSFHQLLSKPQNSLLARISRGYYKELPYFFNSW